MNIVDPKKQLKQLHDPINEEEKAKGKSRPVWKIALIDKPSRFWETIKKTLAGQTTVGRIGRTLKNIFKHILPYGQPIDSITDAIGNQLKTNDTIMADEAKTPTRSRTIATFALLFLVGLASQTGLLPADIALSPEAAWVDMAISVIGIALRAITDKPISWAE